MQYAIIKSKTSDELFDFTQRLIDKTKIMYQSILFPYVDALVMNKKEKAGLYFQTQMIIQLDFLSSEEFVDFMKDETMVSYEIKSNLSSADIFFSQRIKDGYRFYADDGFSFSKPHELRSQARKMSALAEISDRIVKEYDGEILSVSINELFFEVENKNINSVLKRIKDAKTAIFN